MTIMKKTATIFVVLALLTNCSSRSRTDDAIAGVMAGAMIGGAGGTVCCQNPVDGLPLGILIGGVVGGIVGFLWPTDR